MLLLTEDLAAAQLAVQQLVLALLVLPAGRVAPSDSQVTLGDIFLSKFLDLSRKGEGGFFSPELK